MKLHCANTPHWLHDKQHNPQVDAIEPRWRELDQLARRGVALVLANGALLGAVRVGLGAANLF